MPRICTICDHPRRRDIDLDLAGFDCRGRIADRYGVSYHALCRHFHAHMPAAFLEARAEGEASRADELAGEARHLYDRTLWLLECAEEGRDLRTALSAVRHLRGNLE